MIANSVRSWVQELIAWITQIGSQCVEYYNSHERATGQAILEDRCSALVMHIFEDRCSAVRHCSGLQVKPVLLPPQGNYSTARIANLSALSKTSTLAPNFFCFLRSPANVRMSPEQPTRFHVHWMLQRSRPVYRVTLKYNVCMPSIRLAPRS